MHQNPSHHIHAAISRAIAPRPPLTVSQWADKYRRLSSKGSAEPGAWSTARNPVMREPMDVMSARSVVRESVDILPIQFGKTELELNVLGYAMDVAPGPIMALLPSEKLRDVWQTQKLTPMLDETERLQPLLRAHNKSRDAANTKNFKEFAGGLLYLEHAGTPSGLKSKSVRWLLVDEFSSVAAQLQSGEDAVSLMDGRTSAYQATYKRLYVGSPGVNGVCHLQAKWEISDQRLPLVPCPHCQHEQYLQWSGLHWHRAAESGHITRAWYVCQECGAEIDEHHKPAMFRAVHWSPTNLHGRIAGFRANGLYYPIGLGPSWASLAQEWLDAQNDPAKLRVFVCDRLAEWWEDKSSRNIRDNVVQDRAEPYQLRFAPRGVLLITAGVDTQDDRLEVQIVGWGRGGRAWTLDYVVLPGDPESPEVWDALTDLINRGVQHECGRVMPVSSVAHDAGGHRTEAVKNFSRTGRIRRFMATFGAKHNNAPVLGKPKLADVTWAGKTDRRGVKTWQVGTVAIKDVFFARIGKDADREVDDRMVHFPDQLDRAFFVGVTSEIYDPRKNRYEKKRGARNEPLDTWVYAYAAAHHPEIRIHHKRASDWDALEAQYTVVETEEENKPNETAERKTDVPAAPRSIRSRTKPRGRNFVTTW